MNKKQRLLGLLGTALICALMAGGAVSTAMTAAGLGACAPQAYLCALAGALVCAAFSWSAVSGVVAAATATLGAGTYIALNIKSGGAVSVLFEAAKALRAGTEFDIAPGSGLIAGAGGAVFAALLYAMLIDHSVITTTTAIAVCLGTAVVSAATGDSVSLISLLPVTAGACAAIAHTSEQRRNGGHIMALIPACLAVLLAMALIPAGGTTFAPLESAANRVRQLYEDYFNYTKERVAYSISENGYDYYGLRDDIATHMLGGPANPTREAVMSVETDSELLLRGTVREIYTGYSWEDGAARARHLYFDFTRRSLRDDTMGVTLYESLKNADAAFIQTSAKITMLKSGSSTLFVPIRLTDFAMGMGNAVYYNTVGEMFMARGVESGDEYSFTAAAPADYSSVSALAGEIMGADGDYEKIKATYTALPEGIDEGVYKIAAALTEGGGTDADKALRILNGLKANCEYALDVEYPPQDRDFVSYFLLESRKGYCSYFATAMAVLCRAEGIPARYVEGYKVYPEADGVTTVTGEDAHAWTEVYLKGIGWIAYDPTPGNGESAGETGNSGNSNLPDATPDPTPTPDSTPEPTENASTNVETTPSPAPQGGETTPPPQNENTQGGKSSGGGWLWIVLAALLIAAMIALLWLWFKSRLEKTDPVRLAAKQKSDDKAVIILYRAMLTLLSQLGQTPANGESPEAFARRVQSTSLANEDFEIFARELTVARYSGRGATKELTSLGARAYLRFRGQLKKREKLSFDIYRVLHGLGSFENIP